MMQTLISKKPISPFLRHLLHSSSFFLQSRKTHNLLRIHPKKCHRGLRTVTLCTAQSLGYGGWDDFQLIDESGYSGESNQFHNFLNSLGIGDKKYVFVYLFGFVCALAIARVKVSSIIVFPAGAVIFALGFSVGLVKGGHLKELRLNGNRKKLVDDTVGGLMENLRNLGNNLQGCNEKVLNLKNDIKRNIERNHVTVSELEGYIDVVESADISFRNAIDIVQKCSQSILGGNQEQGKRKKSRENGFNFSRYFGGLFGGKLDDQKPGKMEGSGEMDWMDAEVNNKKRANIFTAPVREKNLNSALNENLGNTSVSTFDSPSDGTLGSRKRIEELLDGTEMENIGVGNEKRNVVEANDTNANTNANEVFDQTIYSYQNTTSRVANNQRVWLKDYQDETETVLSQNDSYDSVDVSIRMNHMKTAASFGRRRKSETPNNYSYHENTEEDLQESQRYSHKGRAFSSKTKHSFAKQESAHENICSSSPSSTLDNDSEFSSYLAEANNLLKEAKGCLTRQVDGGRAEHALNKSAILLSKAIEMRPMSFLAVGQLGNTYLLHGEIKLRMCRELRSLLVRNVPLSVEEWETFLNRFDNQFDNKDKITSVLTNVCEECEELLIKAGRKYKLALSIDGNDMRALYNWGLALSFRAQLIADIGPSAARDADKIFLAAIDKFDAMMSKSNTYAPDALFRWGAALQQRSRLRPSRSKEKVKLLQQARRLYEDALDMDSGNLQLQEALSSCISELEYWYS